MKLVNAARALLAGALLCLVASAASAAIPTPPTHITRGPTAPTSYGPSIVALHEDTTLGLQLRWDGANSVWRDAQGAVRPAAAYLGPVATKVALPELTSTALFQSMSRTCHYATDDISAVRVAIANWYVNTSTDVETNPTSTLTAHVAIEYPAGTFTELLWSGVSSGAITAGTTGLSDLTTLSVTIPRGAQFWEREWLSSSWGVMYAGAHDQSCGDWFTMATTTTDRVLDGTLNTGNSGNNNRPPVAILGYTKRPTAIIHGDSRTYGVMGGTGTTRDVFDTVGNRGEVTPLLGLTGNIHLGLPGNRVDKLVAGHALRGAFGAYVTDVIIQLGLNDVSNSRTAAQVMADYATVASWYPGKRIWHTTMGPITTSTDGFTTTTNQTGSGLPQVLAELNDSIRDITHTGQTTFSGYWEAADAVESARNSGKWVVPPNQRTVTDAAITSGAATLTSATAVFTTADIGTAVQIAGAGASSASLVASILAVGSQTSVTISTNASTTVSAATARIGGATVDGTHESGWAYKRIRTLPAPLVVAPGFASPRFGAIRPTSANDNHAVPASLRGVLAPWLRDAA